VFCRRKQASRVQPAPAPEEPAAPAKPGVSLKQLMKDSSKSAAKAKAGKHGCAGACAPGLSRSPLLLCTACARPAARRPEGKRPSLFTRVVRAGQAPWTRLRTMRCT